MKFYITLINVLLCSSLFFSCSKDKDNDTPQPAQPLITKATSTLGFNFSDPFASISTSQYYTSSSISFSPGSYVQGDFDGLDGPMFIEIDLSKSSGNAYEIDGNFEVRYQSSRFLFHFDNHQKVIIDHMDTQTIEGHFDKINSYSPQLNWGYLTQGSFKIFL